MFKINMLPLSYFDHATFYHIIFLAYNYTVILTVSKMIMMQ